MHDGSIVLLAASVLDLVLGDPVYPLHPVRLIGRFIQRWELWLRHIRADGVAGGFLLLAGVLTVALAVQQGIRLVLTGLSPYLAVAWDIYVLTSCVALRDMLRHACPVATALRQENIAMARAQLQKVVGRDVSLLDAAGVARAAVESVAESLVDGFLAPIFWFVVAYLIAAMGEVGPLPYAVGAALIYRCVNTLDSMVGYRNDRYFRFGWASARADDVLNFLPARLSLGGLWLGALLLGMKAAAGWSVAMCDRLKHASPNSAHAESFVAGALCIRLGGPTVYAHGTVDKPWLGDSLETVTPAHIDSCGRLILVTGIVSVVVALLLIEVFA
ncbi:MAG: cobalamin biosynthesis protein CobD [Kiritimatiellae bacterium]|nr:cobalamin biosynthesis protein CobD [Kiritimatiellia bacterium]